MKSILTMKNRIKIYKLANSIAKLVQEFTFEADCILE